MDALQEVLGYWHRTVLATSPSRSIGVVEASIINASLMLDRVLLSTAFDEETITAALLGGLVPACHGLQQSSARANRTPLISRGATTRRPLRQTLPQ